MRKLLPGVCVTLAFASLFACSKPSTPPADASAAAPAASGTPAVAAAGSGPALKTGEWEVTTALPSKVANLGKDMVTKMCLDSELSSRFEKLGSSNPGKLDCAAQEVRHVGNVIDVDSTCKASGLTVHTKMHMEMTGDNAYHQTIQTSYDPPMGEPMTTEINGKWLGPCSAGMQPGDMILPGGRKINMNAIAAQKSQKKAP